MWHLWGGPAVMQNDLGFGASCNQKSKKQLKVLKSLRVLSTWGEGALRNICRVGAASTSPRESHRGATFGKTEIMGNADKKWETWEKNMRNLLYLCCIDSATPSRNRAHRYLVRFFCFSMRRFAVTRGSAAVMWFALTCVESCALLCHLETCKLWLKNTHQSYIEQHRHVSLRSEATLFLDLGPIELCDPSSHRLGLFSSIDVGIVFRHVTYLDQITVLACFGPCL